MPQLNTGLWQNDQNTKYPAISHWISYRLSLTANTTSTTAIPTSFTNPAQATPVGPAPTGEPQLGKRFFLTQLVIRDSAGNLSGAGATAGGTIALVDTTTSTTLATVTSPASASISPYVVAPVTTGLGVINPYDSLSLTYTQPTGATATATAVTVDIIGFWQQGV